MRRIECRKGCGACCIVLEIKSPLPGMFRGKPAGVRCENLSSLNECLLYGSPFYPPVCAEFEPTEERCGQSRAEAFYLLASVECELEGAFGP